MFYIFIFLIILYHLLIFILGTWNDFKKYKISSFNYYQRFGFNNNYCKVDYLIHAVSCGEAMSTQPLIDLIEKNKKKYLLTVHTPTGFNLIKKKVKYSILKPFDLIPTMFYLILKTQPKILFIAESDSWPFMILFAKLFGTKIYYINYTLKGCLRNYYHYLLSNKIYLKIDAKNKKKKYHFLGNLKWLSTNKIIDQKFKKNSLIISSAGKDEIDIHLKLIRSFPNINFIYVPRHLNWENELKDKLQDFKYLWLTHENQIGDIENTNLTIIWSFGLLNKLYAKTHICLMGDTFNSVGGHNLVEPAIHENALILGPNYHTCQDLAEELNIIYVKKIEELILKLKDNQSFNKNGKKNYQFVFNKQKNIKEKLITILDLN